MRNLPTISRVRLKERTRTTCEEHYARCIAVVHLDSTAVGAPWHYTRCPDTHRSEPVAEAARLDRLLGELWRGYPGNTFGPGRESMEDQTEEARALLETAAGSSGSPDGIECTCEVLRSWYNGC